MVKNSTSVSPHVTEAFVRGWERILGRRSGDVTAEYVPRVACVAIIDCRVKIPVSDKKCVAGAHPDRGSLSKSDEVTLTQRHGSSNEVGHPDALGN